jgi:hypothetical protein
MAVQYESATLVCQTGPGRRPLSKWIIRSLVGGATLIGIALLVLAYNWPFKEQALKDVLQERSVRSVTVDHFRVTYFPPGCIAEGVKFLRRKHKDKPPLITISRVEVRGSYLGMITPHKRLSDVRVYGLHVTVPPPAPNGGPNPVMPLTKSGSGRSVIIGTVTLESTVLDFIQKTPGEPPVHVVVPRLTLDGVGNDQPLRYRAAIGISSPPSAIESKGEFGTWDPDEPARTPLKGWYRLQQGDLGVYKAISGILASTGDFGGTLGEIEVHGRADVPDFHVSGSSHSRDLKADYDAVVNGTDGNVLLKDVVARFDRSTIRFDGAIEGHPGRNGKAVSLDMTSSSSRIEDLLDLFIQAKRAPFTGNVEFAGQFTLPPKPASFLNDMQVQGEFGVAAGKFRSQEIQTSLSRISESAANKDHLPLEDPATLVSNLHGRVMVKDAIANLAGLSLRVPGAEASLDGTYNLANYKVDLHGTLMTDGSAAAAATGFKSFLLTAISPFLKKKEGRQTIPFKIAGTYQKVQVGLDLGHKK